MREFWEKLQGRYAAVKVRVALKPLLIAMVFVLVGIVGCLSCTEQARTKHYGGTMTVTIPAGRKLVTVTWKAETLWYLTRPIRLGEAVEEYEFKERSALGFVEGKVVFKETAR